MLEYFLGILRTFYKYFIITFYEYVVFVGYISKCILVNVEMTKMKQTFQSLLSHSQCSNIVKNLINAILLKR